MTRRQTANVEATAMARFKEVLTRIDREFPLLNLKPDFGHPHVDAIADIPRQAGLVFGLSINLQDDELQLNVGRFCLEWFPCTKPDIAEDFADTVCDLLRGACRIVEHLSSGKPVKGQLQRYVDGRWKTIGSWYSGAGVLPWPRPKRVVQNPGCLPRGEVPGRPDI